MENQTNLNIVMRLNELSIPKSLHNASYILQRAGYKLLGKPGSWGKVYQKDGSPYVLKLFENEDTAYTAYIDLCKKHNNRFLPKIIGKVVRVTDHYSAVRLEPLTPFPDFSERVYPFIIGCELYIRSLNYQHKKPDNMLDAIEQIESNPDLTEACKLIASLLPKYELDLSPHNVMLRGKQYVFTDPIKVVNFVRL